MSNLILCIIVGMDMINMKKSLLVFCLVFGITSIKAELDSDQKKTILARLSRERYFPYQDIVINNEIISKGVGPDCQSRYDAISKIISKYNRPIKVLDLGASNGYFSFRIAHDYGAMCVMVDVSDRLRDICELNDQIKNIIYLKREFLLDDLKTLCKYEHFDVVLALNVVHHMSDWKEVLDTIFQLGDTIIIETPPANDDRVGELPCIPLIEDYLLKKSNGQIIAKTPRAAANNFDQIIILDGKTDYLKQKKCIPDAYAKMFCFENVLASLNKPVFNPDAFRLLNGVFPYAGF